MPTSTSPTSGGIYIQHTGNVALSASATSGPVDVSSTGTMTVSSVTGAGVTLATGGTGKNLNVNGPVSAGTSAVSLTASGAITAGAGEQITTTNTLTATGTAIGANGASLNTTVGKLDASATNGGIFVSQSGALELIASATGAVSVATGQAPASGGAITVDSASGNGVTR